MEKNVTRPVFAVLAFVCLFPSCATLFQQNKQGIHVISSPENATVSVNGKPLGAAPKVVWLAKSKRNQVIRIESPGYNPVEVTVERRPALMAFFSDAALGLTVSALYEFVAFVRRDERDTTWGLSLPICIGIPVLIDLASGRAHTLSRKTLSVTLTKAAGLPRVQTILIDADEIKNIRWILVRAD
jgi:PEGA domain